MKPRSDSHPLHSVSVKTFTCLLAVIITAASWTGSTLLFAAEASWENALRNALFQYPSLFDDNAIAAMRDYKVKPEDADGDFLPARYSCYDFQQDGVPELVVTFLNPGNNQERNDIYSFAETDYIKRASFEGGDFYQKEEGQEYRQTQIVFVAKAEQGIISFSYLSADGDKYTLTPYIDSAGLDKETGETHEMGNLSVQAIDPSLKALLQTDIGTIAQGVETALKTQPEFLYGDYEGEKKRVSRIAEALAPVQDAEGAVSFIEANIQELEAEQIEDGNVADAFVRYMELALMQSTAKALESPVFTLDSGILGSGAASLDETAKRVDELIERAKFPLLRDRRRLLLLTTEEEHAVSFEFNDTIKAIDFEQVTVSAPFADVSLSKDFLMGNGSIKLENPAWKPAVDSSIHLLDLWSVPPMILAVLIWRLNKRMRLLLKFWVVPAFCVLLLSINAGVLSIQSAVRETMLATQETGAVLEMGAETEVTLSLPLPEDTDDPNQWLVFFEGDEPVYSVYNPMTNKVDAVVTESGHYTVGLNELDFQDISQKNALMRDSIRSLAAMNIMPGTIDGMFFPDKAITRAEFVSAILRIFRLVDPNATSTFSDVSEDDWYYADVATAEKLKLIDGFAEDNTFRGDITLPKDQMVAICMRFLSQAMNYKAPSQDELEYILCRYTDYKNVSSWAKENVALASQVGLVLYRTDWRFAPDEGVTRGDAAIMLKRVFEKVW
jgi:hypothetical protein